jgi:GDP-L-fucose synthase
MKEDYLLSGPLEPTNRPYAVAKIAGIESCWAYNRQYGTRYLAVMPTNLYGPGDSYDLENSHVLPALIRKMHEAKIRGDKKVIAWGTGSPRREFLYSDDMADACVYLMSLPDNEFSAFFNVDSAPMVNIGCGKDNTIKELVYLVKEIIGFTGEIEWDTSKPDGTMQKLLAIQRLSSLGWQPKMSLKEGVKLAYKDYLCRETTEG